MGVKIKNLEAAARHELELRATLDAEVRDTIVVRDTVPVPLQKIEMQTPHIQLTGLIEDDHLRGDIRVPMTLRQAVWIEYRRRWIFWKQVKAIHQTIREIPPMSR